MKQEMMNVVSITKIAPQIYELVLSGQLVAEMQTPGQFLHLKVPRADLLLRRPISLAKIAPEKSECTLIFRVEGDGTREFSRLQSGDLVDVMGPLGNGFPLAEVAAEEVIFVIGGGIGVPPLYELSRRLTQKQAKVIHLFGFQTVELAYYQEEFAALGPVHYATNDGTLGVTGHVGHLLAALTEQYQPAAVYACGATGLLKAVAETFSTHPRVYLSLEERMACGMGACYACVCTLEENGVEVTKKVCDQGPIFKGEAVRL